MFKLLQIGVSALLAVWCCALNKLCEIKEKKIKNKFRAFFFYVGGLINSKKKKKIEMKVSVT